MIVRLTDTDKRLKDAVEHVDRILENPEFDLNDIDLIDQAYDDAFRPTEGSNPKSRWSKKAILEGAKSGGVPQSGMDILNKMTLEDLRKLFLKRDSVCLCGGRGQYNHTVYYAIDLDFMKEFLGVES